MIHLARRASSTRTTRQFTPAERETELNITLDQLDCAIELADNWTGADWTDGQKLFFVASYNEDFTGRLHCQQLEGISKPVRDAIFAGFYQYDIVSCMPTAWIQMYREIEPSGITPRLDEYFADPQRFREKLADLLGTDVGTAKWLTNCTFGGMLIPVSQAHVNMLNHLNVPIDILAKLTQDQVLILNHDMEFMEFYREIRMIQKTIRKHHRKTNRHMITNAAGKDMIENPVLSGKPPPGQFKGWHSIRRINAFLWMGVERQILDVVRQVRDPVVTIHDGFITKNEIKVGQLEQLIYIRTGFRMKYKYEQLGTTASGGHFNMTTITKGKYKGESIDNLLKDRTYVKRFVHRKYFKETCPQQHEQVMATNQAKSEFVRVKMPWEYSEPQWRKELPEKEGYPPWQELPNERPGSKRVVEVNKQTKNERNNKCTI